MPEWSGSGAAGASVYSLPTPSGGHASTPSVPMGEPAISYTSVLLAVVVGIVHAGLSPVIEIGGVRPNLGLVGRLVWVYPIVAALAGSVLADLVSLGVLRLIDAPLQVGVPIDLIVPAAVLNAALVGVLLYPARVATARLRPDERAAW